MRIRFYCADARAIARQRCRRGGIASAAGNDDGCGDNRRSYSDSDWGRDGIRGDESYRLANGRRNAVGGGFDTLSIALRVLSLALSQPRCEHQRAVSHALLLIFYSVGDKSEDLSGGETNCHKTRCLRGCHWL